MILEVNKVYKYNFPYPPTHITLFTLKNMEGGIGLNSTKEYNCLTSKINQKETKLLSKSFKLIK